MGPDLPGALVTCVHFFLTRDVDWSAAVKELGFKPRDPTDTLKDTIEYIRKNHVHPRVNGSKPPKGPPMQWLPNFLGVMIVAVLALVVFRRQRRNKLLKVM